MLTATQALLDSARCEYLDVGHASILSGELALNSVAARDVGSLRHLWAHRDMDRKSGVIGSMADEDYGVRPNPRCGSGIAALAILKRGGVAEVGATARPRMGAQPSAS